MYRDKAQELHKLKEKNVELRRQQEKTSKELAVTKQQLDSARCQLHATERARSTTQQGPAGVKAAKLQSDVEWLEKENSVLFGDLYAKAKEAEELKLELHKQQKLLDQAAAGLGLPSSAVLDELYDLRAQAIHLSDALAEKEDTMKRHAVDLKDMQTFRGLCNMLASRTADLEARTQASEAQCTELLDFIEEKQGVEASLAAERDAASFEVTELKREMRQAHKATLELQELLHRTQAERKAMQMELSSKKLGEADAQRYTTELQVLAAGAQKQLDFMERELRVLLKSLHETLGRSGDPFEQDQASRLTAMDAPCSPMPPSKPAEVVGLLAQVSQNLRLVLTGHVDLQKAADHHQHLARQNMQLWDQLSTLEPQHAHARALVADLQAQVSASAANWKQLVQALIDHFDPTSSHACIAGREYEAASAVGAHITRTSQARERSQEQILQLEGMVAALRKELTECQDDLAVARRNCVLRPCPEEYEAALQEQHQAKGRMLALTDRLSASEAQARQCLHQMFDLQTTLQAREQQLKTLQQENAEQQQELFTLRTLRAGILMRKGCKGLLEQQNSASMPFTAQPALQPASPTRPSPPSSFSMLTPAYPHQVPQHWPQLQPALLGHTMQRQPPISQEHHRPAPLIQPSLRPRASRRRNRMHVVNPPGFPGPYNSSSSSSESSPAAHSPPPPRFFATKPGQEGYPTAAGAPTSAPLHARAAVRMSRGSRPAAVHEPAGFTSCAQPLPRRTSSSSDDDGGDGQGESFGQRRPPGEFPGKPPQPPPPPPVPCKHPTSSDDDCDDQRLEVRRHGRHGMPAVAALPQGKSLKKASHCPSRSPLPPKHASFSDDDNDVGPEDRVCSSRSVQAPAAPTLGRFPGKLS